MLFVAVVYFCTLGIEFLSEFIEEELFIFTGPTQKEKQKQNNK